MSRSGYRKLPKDYALRVAEELGADAAKPHNMTLMYKHYDDLLWKLQKTIADLRHLQEFLKPDVKEYMTWHDKVIPSAQRELQRLHQENEDLRSMLSLTKMSRAKQTTKAKA
jgi:hypothetical protein